MQRLEWSEAFRVGHAALDQQHEGLLALINRLIDLDRGVDARVFTAVLNELLEYAEKHFSVEEELMQVHGFSGMAAHLAEHEDFVQSVIRLRQRFDSSDATCRGVARFFLKSWYVGHVLGTDRQYIPLLSAETPL